MLLLGSVSLSILTCAQYEPLIKNCCPLEKNLEPFAVIGKMALTDLRAKLASAKSGSKCIVRGSANSRLTISRTGRIVKTVP
jgi:hypothetical protein